MPNERRCLAISALLLAVFLVVGTVTSTQAVEAPAAYIVDATGIDVPLFQDARRIVTLAPNVTEMVCYLGYGERLVGVSDFCDYPPDIVAGLPRVGGFIDTSLEAIVALNPDLVIAYQGNSRELVDQLRALGINVLAFAEATSLKVITGQLYDLSNVIDVETFTNNTAADEFNRWRKQYPADAATSGPPVTIFFGYPGELSYTCGPGSFLDDMIRRAGCRNAVTTGSDRWPMVGAEFIIAADPTVILTATNCTADQDPEAVHTEMLRTLRADPVWSSLEAVRQGRVIVIDSDVLMRPGPRLREALETMILQLGTLGYYPTQPAGYSQ